jgi:hypothetical protein
MFFEFVFRDTQHTRGEIQAVDPACRSRAGCERRQGLACAAPNLEDAFPALDTEHLKAARSGSPLAGSTEQVIPATQAVVIGAGRLAICGRQSQIVN